MKQREKLSSLTRVPAVAAHIRWKTDEEGVITLLVENTGWANRLAQVLFGRPRCSCVQLDNLGSFVWQRVDGRRTVAHLGELVEAQFGEASYPLHERLLGYLQILHSYGFIRWV